MVKTAVITDSAANLTDEYLHAHEHVFVLPLIIVVDGKEFRDQTEINAAEVYAKLDSAVVTSSLPRREDLEKLLERLKAEGYADVLAINLSSGLSGTFNAFRLAFRDVVGLNVVHYDSKTLAAGLGYLVEYAADLVAAGTPAKAIPPLLDRLRHEDSLAFYTINTLKYLRRGGRIGKVEGTIGDILHIKPVITVNDEGVYVTLSKGFGLHRSLITMKRLLVEKFDHDLIDLTIHYGDDPAKAAELGESLKRELNVRTLTISPLTPVLGIHTGPEMFAYVARRIRS
ncbi:MAG: DegV family protein [Candidatus Izemoplasmatales bacterium]